MSAACFIPNKKPEGILNAVLTEWLSKYGTCERKLHDLGGEFNGDNLGDLMGTLGIRVTTPAAFSPFSNGTVERHKSVLKSMLTKLRGDQDFKTLHDQTLLGQAVYAKITLLNRHGFSPFQLVFGKHYLALNMETNFQNCGADNKERNSKISLQRPDNNS